VLLTDGFSWVADGWIVRRADIDHPRCGAVAANGRSEPKAFLEILPANAQMSAAAEMDLN